MRHTRPLAVALLAAAWATMICVGSSSAQQQNEQRKQQKEQANRQQSITVPASDRIIAIRASLPDQVKVGETFEYQIEVANVTDNVMVRDVKIRQTKGDGVAIESAQLARKQGSKTQQKQQGQKQSGSSAEGQQAKQKQQQQQDKQGQSNASKQKQQQEEKQAQSDASKQQQGQKAKQQQKQQQQQQAKSDASKQQQSAQRQGGRQWTIDELGPGESRTIHITANSQKEGQLQMCLAVTSYTPAICLTTKSVQADLELVKQAPKQADLCGEIEWEYYVKNTGSGDPGKFTIQDDLPEGLQTTAGEKQLKFTVDGIEPDDVRKFVATLVADKAGDYRSAAVAIRGEGKRTRSNEAGTKVVAADLRVAIDGPQARYINRLADYTVRVTNHGEAAADDTRLTLHYPRELQMANVTQPRASNNGVSKTQTANAGSRQSRQKQNQQGQNQQAQPERAQPQQGQDQQAQNQQAQNQQAQNQQAQNQQAQNQQAQNQQAQNQQGQQQQDSRQGQANVLEPSETRTWQLGTLEPGETIELGFTVRGSRSGQAEFKAEAMYACQTAKDEEETTSVASARTQLIALPALMVAVVDNQDPVKVGEEFQYTIVVGNEGEAPDSNIEVKVELPGELQFVEASGDTKTESTGQTVQFAPVEELRPGQKARWTLTAKADQKGQIRLPVSVTSNQLSRATTSEEPTVLFASGERVTERPEETPAR